MAKSDHIRIGGHRKVLRMERQNYLSNLSEYEGMSLRAIAKQTGHHFNTVKKYVGRDDWNTSYKPRKERERKLEPLKATIDGWIAEDLKRSRKHRRTCTKIYNDIKADAELSKQLSAGKQTVINYVSQRKKELSKKTSSTAQHFRFAKAALKTPLKRRRFQNARPAFLRVHNVWRTFDV